MALTDYAFDDPGPIPPELMDEPMSEAQRAIEAAFAVAETADLTIIEAIELLADEPAEGDGEPVRWRVENDDDAEWAMRHHATALAELEALRARAQRWQEKIQVWFEQAGREPARTAEFFGAHLE